MKSKNYLIVLAVCCSWFPIFAQQGNSQFENKRLDAELDLANASKLITDLKKDDATAYSTLKDIIDRNKSPKALNSLSTSLSVFRDEITNAFKAIDNGDNVAVILVYKGLAVDGSSFKIDQSQITSKVFHKNSKGDQKFSSYLLSTKKIYFILVDMNEEYYSAYQGIGIRLSDAVVKVVYKNSYLKQSFLDLVEVWKDRIGLTAPPPTLKLTLIQVKPSMVKDPCNVVLSNKAFKEEPTFAVHETNFASFQVGVSNSKVSTNNLSISDGNLVITPDQAQSSEWKSNAYALLEIHLPRDIDNFRPLWKTLFAKRPDDEKIAYGKWFYDNTISRIGLYGGLKIDKDPLSRLYAGCNYALTKEFAVNFGWTWANEFTPQVTGIGDITSISDALKYADRKYSNAKFSIGLSFTPTAFVTTLGLKSKSENSDN